ncbi:restriction endonuclease subunit S [Acinetobacter pittii]|uniref:restriction endonuclease subunit S n=1 Tax=Acinetobacter pittii TaxID=48296 RepID=UPI00083F6E7A|nr:restriction endonuclease subunit S [Acinetobacter pittii]ODL95389.1 hypothetical protein AXH21_07860 [Acinetobacter pittii]
MTILPTSWCEIEFDEGFESISSNTNKIKQKSYLSIGEIPVIDQGENFISGYTNDPDSLVKISSPLIGFGDHTRRFKFITHPFAIGADGLKLIKPINNLLNPKFAYYQLLNTKIEDRGYSRHYQYLRKSKFNLAPLNEQTRIVDKIDELFSELDNGIEELETAQRKLELYRQSLLKSAVEGELSKEWRETQTEISGTGERLLVRILKERRESWEQEKLKEFTERGKNPPKDWQEKYPEPIQPDTTNLPLLPEGWVWATIDQLTIEQRYGTSAKTNDDQNGIPVLRMGNIQNGAIDFNNLKYLPKNHDEFPSLLLEKGDLLFNRTNSRELVGKTAIYNGEYIPCSYASYLIKVRFHSDFNSNLAAYYINSVFGKVWINDVAVQQTGQANVNGTKLSQLCIPVMSQAEQSYIVEKFKELKDTCESSFIQIGNNIKLLTMQKQNILKDAFTGVLVEQDPNDEPAQLLLERIKQQQKAEALTKKNTPKKYSAPKVKKEIGMSQTILEILQQQSDWISGQALATAFGLSIHSSIEDIEQFYEQLRTLSLDDKIMVKPDQQNNKEQDLIKLKDKTDAS